MHNSYLGLIILPGIRFHPDSYLWFILSGKEFSKSRNSNEIFLAHNITKSDLENAFSEIRERKNAYFHDKPFFSYFSDAHMVYFQMLSLTFFIKHHNRVRKYYIYFILLIILCQVV